MGQGNIIGKPNLPATTSAKGVWNLREQNTANRASLWPGYDPQWSNTTLLMKTGPGQVATDTSAYSTYGTPTFSQSDVPYAGIGLGSVTIDTGTAQESVYVTGANMAIGNGNFTVEAWVRYQNFTGGLVATSRWAGNQSNIYWYLGVTSGGRPLFLTRSNSFYTDYGANSTTNVLSTGVWYHMAGVREGGVLKLYINGVLQNVTQSDGGVDLTEQSVSIGFFNYSGYTAGSNATISGFRLTKSAVYTANFTPPTTKPTALANNVLLLNFDGNSGTVTDATGKNALTSTATVANTPALFDGNALSLSGSTSVTTTATSGNTLVGNFAFGTGDFTIEAWIYPTSASGDRCIFSTRGNQANAVYFGMYTNAYTLGFYTASAWIVTSTVAAPANAWSHVALVRASGVAYLYLNGACVGSAANTTNLTESVGTIGRSTGDNAYGFIGSLEEVRVTKAARYTGAFTPPTTAFDRDWEPPYNDTLVNSNVLQVKSIDLPGATNNVFRDDSANAFLPVRYGDATQGSFSPYIPSGYWSNYFDGSGDFLQVTNNAALQFGTGDFTCEGWFFLNNTQTNNPVGLFSIGSYNAGITLRYQTGVDSLYVNGTYYDWLPTTTLPKGQWNHVALVRASGTVRVYINGLSVFSVANTANIAQTTATSIGTSTHNTVESIAGHISNFRVVKGTAVYTGTSFTPPTSPLTAITGTSLLTCQDNRFIDRSTNNFTLTRNGDVAVSRFSPFPLTVPVTTVATTNPGSVYFDGSGDCLSVPYTSANFDWWTTDFTIEAWVLSDSWSTWSYNDGSFQSLLVGHNSTTNTDNYWNFGPISDGRVVFYYWNGSRNPLYSTQTLNAGRWNHIAMTKTASGVTIYVNGAASTTTAVAGTPQSAPATYALNIGAGNALRITGYVSNLRVVKGTAVYSGNFTVPTSPLTAITNTKLLTAQGAETVTDASTNNFTITRVGDAKAIDASPFQTTKRATYAYGGSGFFDGAGDYLAVSPNAGFVLDSDFTLESWVYLTSLSNAYGTILGSNRASPSGPHFMILSTGKFRIAAPTVVVADSTTTATVGQWYHVAVTRSGSTVRMFVNGVLETTGSSSATFDFSENGLMRVGSNGWDGASGFLSGHLANLRVVKGTAVYTAAFTPPTSPVTAISGTSLLLNFDNAGVYDATGQRSNIVHYGDVKTSTTVTQLGQSVMYFDGTGDYMNVNGPASPALAFGTGDFTIEGWLRLGVAGGGLNILDFRPTNTNGAYPDLYYNGTKLAYYLNGGDALVGATTIVTNTWYHFALCRSGTTTRLFVNGALDASFSDSTNYLCGVNRPMIGGHGYLNNSSNSWNGYLYDIRITRTARYVAPFTPPSEPFPVA